MDDITSFDLGLQWDEVSLTQLDAIPTQELCHVSGQINEKRFSTPLTESQFKQTLNERIPLRTRHANSWAVSLYNEWAMWRKIQPHTITDQNWPIPALEIGSLKSLDYWFARFIYEIKRKDGKPYPPNTLTNIAAGLQRYLVDVCDRRDVHLLKKDDGTFKTFQHALEKRKKELIAEGVGIAVKKADPVTEKDEERLWERGVFNSDTARGLSYIVYFYNCKMFGLRAMDEHTNLEANQFHTGFDENGRKFLQYEGRLSKTCTGNIDCKAKPKVIRQYSDPSNERCVVSIYEQYLALIGFSGRFYRRPMPNRDNGTIMFSQQAVGVNTLRKYLNDMYRDAGIDYEAENRNITNHSGKVTCCTRLYDKGFDEQSITGRSGHRSTAVRSYKRPSEDLLQNISNALQPPNLNKKKCVRKQKTRNLKTSLQLMIESYKLLFLTELTLSA
ncbi:uncharacterized protein [Ptychodera flava]|uniref:uncharacterized protein n=1 Tax=Ptychodera flava TaxID=63121 RepID=UPI003969DA4F